MDLPPFNALSVPAASGPSATKDAEIASNAARDFEAMFMGQMVDEMLKTVDIGDFGGGHAEETWRSFLSDAIGRSIADQNTTGISKGIETAMQRYATGRDR